MLANQLFSMCSRSLLLKLKTFLFASSIGYIICYCFILGTIDPNESRVAVSDERFDWLCKHYKPASKVPAYLNVVDIAGLVKGASEGQGLGEYFLKINLLVFSFIVGNAFLSHVDACEALFHLCRAFEDDDVTHVEGIKLILLLYINNI